MRGRMRSPEMRDFSRAFYRIRIGRVNQGPESCVVSEIRRCGFIARTPTKGDDVRAAFRGAKGLYGVHPREEAVGCC